MLILGMDIGYSNLKNVSGSSEESLKELLIPVGVILDDTSNGLRVVDENALRVTVGEEHYIAGLCPADISLDYQRTLHADYPSSIPYKALFHATLLSSSSNVIDVLVTGLPVNQFLEESARDKLKAQLLGSHQVTKNKNVEVKKVIVVPQPLGGYMHELSRNHDLSEQRVMVIDPGFFSVDWTIVRNGDVIPRALGTSVKAVSALFEEVSALIFRDYGGKVSIEDLEKAVSNGKDYIILFGDKIVLKPLIADAANIIGELLMSEIKSSLRSIKSDVDSVLLIGGGASMYKGVASSMFPKSKIIEASNPVLSNAYGFWNIGKSVA